MYIYDYIYIYTVTRDRRPLGRRGVHRDAEEASGSADDAAHRLLKIGHDNAGKSSSRRRRLP